MKTLLISGATGLVGAHVLASLAKDSEIKRIYVLLSGVTEQSDMVALQRLRQLIGSNRLTVKYLPACLRSPRFRLPEREWRKLLGTVDLAFHCEERSPFAYVDYSATGINIDTERTWIEFLTSSPDIRLSYLSTAFVSGRRRGLFTEFDLECGQDFYGAWDKERFEAERSLRSSPASKRITIFRASHVVGDSRSGEAFAFDGLYPLLRLLHGSSGARVPGDPRARLDIVPVDYVAAAISALSNEPKTLGRTFHLVAGWDKSIALRDFIDIITAYGQQSKRKVRIVPPVLAPILRAFSARDRLIGSTVQTGLLSQPAVFDDYLAREILMPYGLSCPKPQAYLHKIVDFAELHNLNDRFERIDGNRDISYASRHL